MVAPSHFSTLFSTLAVWERSHQRREHIAAQYFSDIWVVKYRWSLSTNIKMKTELIADYCKHGTYQFESFYHQKWFSFTLSLLLKVVLSSALSFTDYTVTWAGLLVDYILTPRICHSSCSCCVTEKNELNTIQSLLRGSHGMSARRMQSRAASWKSGPNF